MLKYGQIIIFNENRINISYKSHLNKYCIVHINIYIIY
jgi:hypothetical protein